MFWGIKYRSLDFDPVVKARLLKKLEQRSIWENGCRVWQGYRDQKGYGSIHIGNSRYGGYVVKVHRVAWAILKGPPPTDRDLDHRCRNRACWNVEHLRPSTTWENIHAEGSLATAHLNAGKTHCPRGHEYTPDNIRWQRAHGKILGRICKTCDNQRNRDEYWEWRKDNPVEPHPNLRKTHCKQGHEFTPENTYVYRTGKRACRMCRAQWSNANYRPEQIARLKAKLAKLERP
jgi:hypothetical protein